MGPHGDPFEQALVVSKVPFVPQNTHEISKMSASVRIVCLALIFAAGCVMRVHRLTLPPRDGYGNGEGVGGGFLFGPKTNGDLLTLERLIAT